MNSARTLADRFRTQRTDRIRVDGVEVLSIVEVTVHPDECVELMIEECREDIEQSLSVRSSEADLTIVGYDDHDDSNDSGEEIVTITGVSPSRSEIVADGETRRRLQIWNSWLVGGTAHSWIGNCGIVVEEIDPPEGASRRLRLWCSDGLGDPEFDDIVVLVTVGDRA